MLCPCVLTYLSLLKTLDFDSDYDPNETDDTDKTDETDTILGHAVRRYKVKRSAFVRQGATAYVWIAEDVNLPKRRYQFEFEFTRAISPVRA